MEKLKNVYSFHEFIESKNEGIIWNAIKKMFKALFAKVSKRVEEQINNFTKKIEGAKDWKTIQQIIIQNNNDIIAEIEGKYKDAKGLIDIRKIEYDNAVATYIKTSDLYKKTGDENLKPSNFFDDMKIGGYKKAFDYDDVKNFQRNLKKNVDNIVANSALKAGYSKDEIAEMRNTEVEKEALAESKIYEETGEQTGEQDVEGKNTEKKDVKIADKLVKLKTASKDRITNMLTSVNRKYQGYKFTGNIKSVNSGDISNYTGKVDGKNVTNFPGTVKNMAQKLRTADKKTLLSVRKELSPKSPDGGKKEIGSL